MSPASSQAVTGELDPEAVLARRDEVIHDLDDSGQEPWLGEHGIELFRGEGRLDGERRVVVGEETLVAKRVVVVATGSAAAMPPIEGLDSVETWNNRDATTSKRIPRSMIVLGGGPVGAELAQAWSALGTKVDLVEGGERILAREEPFASEEVATALRERHGVDVRTGARAERVGKAGGRRRGRARRRRAARGGASCWSRSDASRARPGSASTRSGSSPARAASSRPTGGCGSAAASGSTRSATSPAGRSSPTWASTDVPTKGRWAEGGVAPVRRRHHPHVVQRKLAPHALNPGRTLNGPEPGSRQPP